MRKGEWADDPYFSSPPDEDQIHDVAKLLVKIEYIGRHGIPFHRSDINYLDQGVWEFRHGVHRIAYFDTPGNGTFEPKRRIQDRNTVDPDCNDEFWWYPHLDPILRLTNGWSKTDQLAPPEEIEASIKIREEDVEHDKQGREDPN